MNSTPQRSTTGHAHYANTRERLFKLTAEELGIAAPPEGPDVWGVVIDYPSPSTITTLVAMTDGAVSLLLSEGPAFLGAGSHQEIAQAAKKLLAKVQSLHSRLKPATDVSLPAKDRARVYLLTTSGTLAGQVLPDEHNDTQRELAEVLQLGDEVITAIRERCQSQNADPSRFTAEDNYLQLKIIGVSVVLGALIGAIAAPERLPGFLTGGIIGLIAGFLSSGILLMAIRAKRRYR